MSGSEDSRFLELQARQSFDGDRCFLCGMALTQETKTVEHVIPKWAQRRFKLGNKTLHLLNGTQIPYRKLVVPCCQHCNGTALKPLEDQMSRAIAKGASAVRALSKATVYLWLSKLFYGLLHRELFLAADRTDPNARGISNPELLESRRVLYALLHATRVPVVLDPVPASILAYDVQVPPAPEKQWDFRDSLATMFLALRVGRVGIVAVLGDGGAQQPIMDEIAQSLPRALHPLQHIEVAAKAAYMASLLRQRPSYLVTETPDEIRVTEVAISSGGSLFDIWDDRAFAETFSAFSGLPKETLYSPGELAYTFLREADGRAKTITLDDLPFS
ncbi:MAG: hypothetical protein R3B07_33130 [Polyangiaceae bacterium]